MAGQLGQCFSRLLKSEPPTQVVICFMQVILEPRLADSVYQEHILLMVEFGIF